MVLRFYNSACFPHLVQHFFLSFLFTSHVLHMSNTDMHCILERCTLWPSKYVAMFVWVSHMFQTSVMLCKGQCQHIFIMLRWLILTGWLQGEWNKRGGARDIMWCYYVMQNFNVSCSPKYYTKRFISVPQATEPWAPLYNKWMISTRSPSLWT